MLTNGVIDLKIATNRLNAFSDGVFAIIITIIVLGISFPSTFDSAHLIPFFGKFLFFFKVLWWLDHFGTCTVTYWTDMNMYLLTLR
ncbi:DUF1211 domain-containing protein [Listeria monocytogenes]|nr:DUF1211 domain-containing protein [Listeria monocytogenes]EAF3595223.1 DUF1211 domain-containing protein [Listeria monocytogenes]